MPRYLLAIFCVFLATRAYAQATGPAATVPAVAAVLPVPSALQQAKALVMIQSLFKAEFAKTGVAERDGLAKTLLAQGKETGDDPAARYVALMTAADLAAGAGDAATAIAAINVVAAGYAVDALELKRNALVRAHGAATTVAESVSVMLLALDAADQAAAVDAFEVVGQLANLAESAGNKTRQVKTVASIQVHLANLRALTAEFAQVKQALARVASEPGNGEAHLVIGRFYALHKGQWGLGLPHLAEGSDELLQGLARQELGKPADAFGQMKLGDGWWDYAEKSEGLTRQYASLHAAEWYQVAQKNLEGITLMRIRSRIQAGLAAGVGNGGGTAEAANRVNLLELIDPAKDGVAGKWTVAGGALVCEVAPYAVLQLPYMPPEEFDLRVSFTRVADDGSLAVLLGTRGRSFGYALDVKGESRFERVDGKISKDNPTLTPVVITNGRRYTLTIQVRKDGVRALLDDKQLMEWKTDYKDLTRYTSWKMKDAGLCGLGVNGAKVVFQAVELVEVTGKGKPTR